MERKAGKNTHAKDTLDREATAKKNRQEKEAVEEYLGVVISRRKVITLSGVLIVLNIEEGLNALGAQPKLFIDESNYYLIENLIIYID